MNADLLKDVCPKMYAEGIASGRTEKEINEEFSGLCRKMAMERVLRERSDLKTTHNCSASPILAVPYENVPESKQTLIQ